MVKKAITLGVSKVNVNTECQLAFAAATRRRNEAFSSDIPFVQDVAMLMDTYHSDPFWAELGSRCLNCTACASVCPTCMCFDIVDELAFDGKTGERVREWDCCTNPQFATVAGGHNFRPSERERVRHRMYHKLNGFKEKHGSMLCVGCGRCVDACKTGINPIEVLKFFDEKTRGAHDAQQGRGETNGE